MCMQAGKLKAFVKSEDEPESNDGPVKVLTANTIDAVVNSGNDVLIEFYAPWCAMFKAVYP